MALSIFANVHYFALLNIKLSSDFSLHWSNDANANDVLQKFDASGHRRISVVLSLVTEPH